MRKMQKYLIPQINTSRFLKFELSVFILLPQTETKILEQTTH